jgi:SET domain-containing protein
MKPPEQKRIQPAVLVIKKSTIPGTGKGLFTRQPIQKGTMIIEYKGLITTLKQVQDSKEVNPYIYFVNRNHVIDAMHFPGSLARYANDADGIATLAGCKNNAKFIVINKKVFLQAIVDILPGAEIFTSYGKDYWDTIKFNLAVDKSYNLTHHKPKKKK